MVLHLVLKGPFVQGSGICLVCHDVAAFRIDVRSNSGRHRSLPLTIAILNRLLLGRCGFSTIPFHCLLRLRPGRRVCVGTTDFASLEGPNAPFACFVACSYGLLSWFVSVSGGFVCSAFSSAVSPLPLMSDDASDVARPPELIHLVKRCPFGRKKLVILVCFLLPPCDSIFIMGIIS